MFDRGSVETVAPETIREDEMSQMLWIAQVFPNLMVIGNATAQEYGADCVIGILFLTC